MKIYYRKLKNVGRENEKDKFEPIGPWRLAVGGSPISLKLPKSQKTSKNEDKLELVRK